MATRQNRSRQNPLSICKAEANTSAKKSDEKKRKEKILVIGGGAAGYFAAIAAAKCSQNAVTIVEQSGSPLEKVRISGGGRCNVTNVISEAVKLAGHYPRGHKELKGAFFRVFGSEDVREWFESRGVELKVERDGRIFPVTNKSETIIKCLQNEADRNNVEILLNANAKTVVRHEKKENDKTDDEDSNDNPSCFHTSVKLGGKVREIDSTSVILATGSSRTGWEIAKGLGHSVIPPYPSLFSFKCTDKNLKQMQGLSLPSVAATLKVNGCKFEESGPLLITHWGLSGPVVLKLSAWAARELAACKYSGVLHLDMCAEKSYEEVEGELLSMKKRKLRKLSAAPPSLQTLPRRLWNYILGRQGLEQDKIYSECKDADLRRLARSCKRLEVEFSGKGPFKEEFVTAGGVDLKEVNLKTMESKITPRLYFAGEVLNVDGVTGGFNFQNAWTSGYLSGTHIAEG